jgi:hypothetical protein
MNLADRAMAENGLSTLDDDRQRRNDQWRQVQASSLKSARPEAHFLDIAGLRASNPLLYRCFPLTCARSQE